MTDSFVPPLGADLVPWARALPSIDGPILQDDDPIRIDERRRIAAGAEARDRDFLAAFRLSAQRDPDVAGEAQRIAARLGKPTKLVELDLDVARGVLLERQMRDLRLRETHPMVMQAIENPNFLRISYDDLENLVATDSLWQSMGRKWDAGRAINERGFIGSRLALGLGTEQDRTRLAEIAETMRNAQRDTGFLAGSAEVLGQMVGTTSTALAAGSTAALAASAFGPISGGTAFAWTTGAAFFAQTAAIEGGNAYLDLLEQGVADDTAGSVALGIGIVNGMLELAGAKVAAKPFQGAVRQIGRRLTGGLAQETTGRAFASALSEYVKALGAEITTEVLQEVSNIVGEAIARPDGGEEPSWLEIRGRLGGIAFKTFEGMALLAIPGPTAHYFAQNRRAEAAIQRADAFDQASQLAAASKVRQRNPDAHAAFAQRVAEEQGVQSVYVDAARFRQAMQETGTTDAELRAQLPDVFRQLEDTDANPERAADVVVPAGEWQAKVTQTKVGAALQPDIRFDADGMSRREADEWMQERSLFGAEARQAAQQAEADDLAFQQSATRVQDSLYQQIRDTGRLPDAKQARGAAQLYATFYETQARRLGMTPEALLEQFPVQFVQAQASAQTASVVEMEGVLWAVDDAARVGGNVTEDGRLVLRADDLAFGSPRLLGRLVDAAIGRGLRIESPSVVTPEQAATLRALSASGYDITRLAGGTAKDGSEHGRKGSAAFWISGRKGADFRADGRGGFSPERLEVLLYQQADVSTFLHEGAHFFLHVYSQLAQTGQATQEMRDDLQTFLDWRGIDSIETWNAMSIDEQRKAHEAFAYSFELRHFEGEQAPDGMQGLFDRFKTWLRALYRNVRDRIAANYRRETGEELPILTGEVRQVMDRMLASESEVATAEAVRNMVPLFQTQEQAGMTDQEWAEYQALDEQKRQQAVNALDEASLRQMRWMSGSRSRILKDLQAQHDAVRREVRKGVATEVMQRPEFAVPLFIRSGEMLQPDGSRVKVETEQERKLNRAQVLKALGFDKPPAKTKKVRGKSLIQFIRDAGGISAESWKKFPGEQSREARAAGVVRGKKGGGMAWDYMADLARSAGYGPQGLSRDQEDYTWFIEAVADGGFGVPLYREQDMAASGYADEEAAFHERSVAPPSPEEMEKIVRQKVLDEIGATAERRKALAPFRGLLADDGVGIDEMAEAFGSGTGESLVRSIQRAGDVAAAIDAETDERMLAEHSDLADPGERERAVERALHNEARQRMVGVELRHLDRSVAPARVMAAAAKEAARQAVAKLPVSGLLARQFAMAEVRARRKATEAVRRGDIGEATLWKRRELLQGAMAKAVGETKAKIDEQVRQIARFARPDDKIAKTRDTRLVNAARWILSRFNLQSQTQEMGAQAAIDAVRSYDPTMYAMLEPLMVDAAQRSQDWRNLTVEQMQTLLAQVDGLWNQAKRVREIELDGRREDKATAIQRILAVLAPRLKGDQKARALTPGEKRKRSFGSILAGMRHVESVTLQWDGGDAGDLHRYLYAMLREPFDVYQVDRNRLVKQLFDDTAALANLGGQKIDAPELGYVFASRAELIGALLHAGNEQNLRKNGVGREWFRRPMEEGERVDTTQWWRFVQRMLSEGKLTRADLDFAQKVWDTFESDLKPRAQRAWFDNYGVYMGEVPADAFSVEIDGQRVNYRGGYFPAAADPDWVEPRQGDVSVDGVTEAGRAAMERYPSTSKGFGIARTEVYRPLLQDVRLAARAFDQELRFIHLQRPARDLASLLNNDEVAAAIREIDPNAMQQMWMPWLEDTVNNRVMAPGGNPVLNRLLVALRRNVGLATMFGNVANALQQVTGLANAAAYVPRKFLRSAASRYASGKRKDMVAGIVDASPFMKLRLEQQVGQVVDDITQLTAPSKFGTAAAWVQRNGYFLQRAMQNPVDVITWAAAHDQAIAEGKTGKQAVRWADTVVRRSQGSGTAADISKAERAGALGRLFTQFSTFWFVQFNQIAQQQTLRGKALTAAWLIGVNGVVAGAISQALRGGWEDEDDDGAMWDDVTGWAFGEAASTTAATALPVGGPILWNLLTGERGGRINTGAVWSSVERSGKALRSMFLEIPFDPERELRGQDIKDVATLLSLLSGLPVSAAARPVSYGLDVALGNVEPSGVVDAARGAITGAAGAGRR